jgi:hypothetical protein
MGYHCDVAGSEEAKTLQALDATGSQELGGTPPGKSGGVFMDAVRFWEPRRVIYNFLLTGVVAFWLVATWPHFRPALTLHSLLLFAALGLIANGCYCAAYIVDIPLQSFSLSSRRLRWAIWTVGTLFAMVLATYWIGDEIYPFVQ